MNFIDEHIEAYAIAHSSEESDLLYKLNRETWSKVLQPRMLSGHLQGRALSLFSNMIRPQYVLEIGTYTGYSALCLAEGLKSNGELHTIDINEELEPLLTRYFSASNFANQIHFHLGNALDIIPTFDLDFDLVFMDADKGNYINYYELLMTRLKPGAFIIADNVLWSGKVLDDYSNLDDDTKTLVDFNKMIQADKRVENVLFPIRDGLMIARVL
ncbi:MAG: O-methyltransferase [Flavobacteriales bacterium]|nr:O-methyltransferase [Flavobacteriales bacterium]